MSQSQDDSVLDQQFLHIKAIEVDFKGNRPRYPISVKLKVDGDERKSPRFGKDNVVRWDMESSLHPSMSADLAVLVQKISKLKCKKECASFDVNCSDLVGKEEHLIEDAQGRASVKFFCVQVAPTHEYAELLAKEANGQVGHKKVFLESLGKAGKVLADLMKFFDLASDVHPAAKAAVIAVNALYERCKQQQECRDKAADFMKDVVSFLPFTGREDFPRDAMKNDSTKQTVKAMLGLFCRISRFILNYSSVGLLIRAK